MVAPHLTLHLLLSRVMSSFFTFLLWCLLLLICWPLAILIILLWPVLWLISIPFRIVGTLLEALLAFVKALLFLPARVVGWRPKRES